MRHHSGMRFSSSICVTHLASGRTSCGSRPPGRIRGRSPRPGSAQPAAPAASNPGNDMHADCGVAGARPARDDRHTGLARQLAIGLGHVDRAGLEAAGHSCSRLRTHRAHRADPGRIRPARRRRASHHWHQRIGQQLAPRAPGNGAACVVHAVSPSRSVARTLARRRPRVTPRLRPMPLPRVDSSAASFAAIARSAWCRAPAAGTAPAPHRASRRSTA